MRRNHGYLLSSGKALLVVCGSHYRESNSRISAEFPDLRPIPARSRVQAWILAFGSEGPRNTMVREDSSNFLMVRPVHVVDRESVAYSLRAPHPRAQPRTRREQPLAGRIHHRRLHRPGQHRPGTAALDRHCSDRPDPVPGTANPRAAAPQPHRPHRHPVGAGAHPVGDFIRALNRAARAHARRSGVWPGPARSRRPVEACQTADTTSPLSPAACRERSPAFLHHQVPTPSAQPHFGLRDHSRIRWRLLAPDRQVPGRPPNNHPCNWEVPAQAGGPAQAGHGWVWRWSDDRVTGCDRQAMGRRRVWCAFSTVSDPTTCGWLGSEPKQEIGPGLPSRLQRSCRQQEHQRLSRTIIPCQVAPGACSAGSRCVFQRGLSTLLDAAQGAVALRHVDFSHVAQNRTSSVGCYSGNVGRTSTGCRIQLCRMAGVSRFFVPESVRHKMNFRAPTHNI